MTTATTKIVTITDVADMLKAVTQELRDWTEQEEGVSSRESMKIVRASEKLLKDWGV